MSKIELKRYTFRIDSLGWFDCDQANAESDTYVLYSDATAAIEKLEGERDAARRLIPKRDGNFLDEMWCCKVCDGEIPDGHMDNCDIWKLEKKHRDFIANEYNNTLTELTAAKAAALARAEAAEAALGEARELLSRTNGYVPYSDGLRDEVIAFVARTAAAQGDGKDG